MKRKFLFSFIILLLLAIVFVVYYVFLQFGALPTDTTEYEKLSYYQNGHFISPKEIVSYPDKVRGNNRGGWFRFLLPNPHSPPKELPQIKPTFDKTPNDFAFYWLGHSSLIIELDSKRFIFDPVFDNAAPIPFVVRRYIDAPLKREELPKIDFVVITHDHYDHLEYKTISYFKDKDTLFIVPLGVDAHLKKWGINEDRIFILGWGDTFNIDKDTSISAEKTIHYSGRRKWKSDKSLWVSYILNGRNSKIFISGDSGYGEHFKNIGEKYGGFDIAFIELDGWNPGWPNTHLFPEDVVKSYYDLNAKMLVPVHWGVFDLAIHPWDESIKMLQELVEKDKNILLTPKMGQKVNNDNISNILDFKWWEEVK